LTRKVVESARPADQILIEARKDYDLMVLGATEDRSSREALFHPVVDQLVRLSPCPTVVVKGSEVGRWPPRRILVPTNGSLAAKRAAEFAYMIADDVGGDIVVLNVVQAQPELYQYARREALAERQLESAREIVEELTKLGQAHGLRVRGEVRQGGDVENVLLNIAQEEQVDLIVIGTDIRPASTRLFFGPRVERTLAAAGCAVVIVNAT
jgi:nucleotide-binding universal stress UspA family protein